MISCLGSWKMKKKLVFKGWMDPWYFEHGKPKITTFADDGDDEYSMFWYSRKGRTVDWGRLWPPLKVKITVEVIGD